MSVRSLGAAVVGCGIYGEVHARAYASDPRVDLVSVWSRRRERAGAVAAKYGAQAVDSLDQIASDQRVHLVSIATPDFAHTEPSLAMLAAGKHLLVEKPMATNSADCLRMIEAERAAGVHLMVNFHNRWHPPLAKAKDLIVSGAIGAPVSGYFRLSDRIEVATELLSWAGRSGPEWFLLPHTVDLARWLTGRNANWVYAVASEGVLSARGIPARDVVQVQADFDGAICSFESSWILPRSWPGIIDFQVQIQGETGRIDIAADQEQIRVSGDVYRTPLVLDFVTEEQPVRHFVDCVVEGRQPVCTGEDGLAVTRIIEAAVQSIESGRPVDLGSAGAGG